MPDNSLPQGAQVVPSGVEYTVWAPERQRVDVLIVTTGGAVARTIPMTRRDDGHFTAIDPQGRVGDRYLHHMDGEFTFPPPVSRFQPEGVHGPAEVIDHRGYTWQDASWTRPAFRELVIYEVHLGTFTTEGTYRAAIARLPHLVDLGTNALELMPLADFPGAHGWGYDGVQPFAPARCYGTPDDLRALVDAAHAHGIAVILDVVYNHFGPDGTYLSQYSPYYFEHEDVTPWGDAVNFGRDHCEPIRAMYRANIRYWMEEFHIDGFRLDATHTICDASEPHILAELAEIVQARGGWVIAEDERNDVCLIVPRPEGGYGFEGVWADDFHHTIEAGITTTSRYQDDFSGELAEVADILQHGWKYRGQPSAHTGKVKGTECGHLPPEQFVLCISNHDQVGNRAFGERLHQLSSPAAYRAASALLLLAPYTPLLFMGQEWSASTPFLYFTDHNEELGRMVEEGRQRECRYAAFTNGVEPATVPSPQAPETFLRSQLKWDELSVGIHAETLALHRELLRIRREHPCFRPPSRSAAAYSALASGVLAMRVDAGYEHWLLLCDLRGGHAVELDAETFTAAPAGQSWRCALSTEEARFGGAGVPQDCARVDFTQPGAVLFCTLR